MENLNPWAITKVQKHQKKVLLKCHELAQAFDVWRVFQEFYHGLHCSIIRSTLVYEFGDPNNAQAGLVSVVVGAGAVRFGLYTGTGGKKNDK